jgi:hypothetical protein
MMMLLLGDEAALAWAVERLAPLRKSREGGSSAWLWSLRVGLGEWAPLEEGAHGRAVLALGPETST